MKRTAVLRALAERLLLLEQLWQDVLAEYRQTGKPEDAVKRSDIGTTVAARRGARKGDRHLRRDVGEALRAHGIEIVLRKGHPTCLGLRKR